MIRSKVHTTRKTGNYVRYFAITILLAAFVASCQKLDSGSDDVRDNIVGVWYCNESDGLNTPKYQVTIAKSASDTTRILISNFNLLGNDVDVYAKLSGLNLSIPNQNVSGFSISGSGSVSSNYKTINLTYTVISGTITEHWTAVYSK